jgi:hypothetical protein
MSAAGRRIARMTLDPAATTVPQATPPSTGPKVTAFHLQQLALELTARDRAIGAPKHANAGRRGFRRPA